MDGSLIPLTGTYPDFIMKGCLLFLFSGFIFFLIFSFVTGLWRIFLQLWRVNRQMKRTVRDFEKAGRAFDEKRADSRAGREAPGAQRPRRAAGDKKIFDKSEGEYVDFEEV